MAIGSKYKPKQIVFLSQWVTVKSLHYSIPIILINSASVYFLSDIDPCYQVDCGLYKYCQVNEADMTYSCICNNCTSSSSKNGYNQQVCDSNGVTHNSRCELDREICLGNTNATWVHDGPCAREYASQSCIPCNLEEANPTVAQTLIALLLQTLKVRKRRC